jgi:hypothetical protein
MQKPSVTVSGTKEFVRFYNSLPKSDPLREKLDDALNLLKKNPCAGDKIQARLFPATYVKKFGIRNLYRYPLGSNYRALYTLVGKSDMIFCVMLDVLDHKKYDNLFGYSTS